MAVATRFVLNGSLSQTAPAPQPTIIVVQGHWEPQPNIPIPTNGGATAQTAAPTTCALK